METVEDREKLTKNSSVSAGQNIFDSGKKKAISESYILLENNFGKKNCAL